MARTARHPRTRAQSVALHNRQVAGVTVGLLVLISAYSAALGSNGWLWLGWTVLLLACVALFAIRT
ncbi:hypothetical protein [Kitasatospora sp. NBC_00458]|uniref:hypothetical protein n=1 Tax=Kitasatospora sp. NBC_00458 TaxID=2903568 RepID=UPI002E19964C